MFFNLIFVVCSTSWKKQPYSRGSYTAMAVGASQEDIEYIAQPLYSNPHQSKVIFNYNFFLSGAGQDLNGDNC